MVMNSRPLSGKTCVSEDDAEEAVEDGSDPATDTGNPDEEDDPDGAKIGS